MNLQASIRIPRRPKDGGDGKGILEVKDFYGLSSSETTEPTEWLSYIPNKPADKYLWNYEKIIYTDGTSTDTKKRVIQGKDARSIESVVNAYAYSASDTVSPTSGCKIVTTYDDVGDGSSIITYETKGLNENNAINLPSFKNEELLSVIGKPKVEVDVFIDRGINNSFDKHIKIGEIKTLESLEKYGNGVFKIKE